MHKLTVFFAIALSAIAASCAERGMIPPLISEPPPAIPDTAPKPGPDKVGLERRTAHQIDASRTRVPSHGNRVTSVPGPARLRVPRAPPPPRPEEPPGHRVWQNLPPVAAPASPLESAAPSARGAAVMPSPPEVGAPVPPEPAAPALPLPEAAMPPLPEPAAPVFPLAALMPPPPEPAEPVLPSQDEIAAGIPPSIPIPELSASLSLRPRPKWEDVTGSLAFPRGPLSEAFEARPETRIPRLIQNPWPLPLHDS